MVILSNSVTLLIYVTGLDRRFVYVFWSIALLVAVVLWARGLAQLSWMELGLSNAGWKRSAIVGVLVGCLLAIPSLTFLSFPFLLAEPARYREIQNLDLLGLFWRLGAELTIATVLTEELLFRSIQQALFKRALGATGAVVATSIVFGLWHLGANALTLQQNTVVLPLIPTAMSQVIGYFGSLVVVGVGGAIFSILRERTNHLAGSMTAHWVSVAVITIGVYLR